jgi:hypothetical protein
VIGCAALLVPVLGGKEGGLLVSPRPLHYGISPCLHRFLNVKSDQLICQNLQLAARTPSYSLSIMLFYAVFVFRHATLRMTGICEAARGGDVLPSAAKP